MEPLGPRGPIKIYLFVRFSRVEYKKLQKPKNCDRTKKAPNPQLPIFTCERDDIPKTRRERRAKPNGGLHNAMLQASGGASVRTDTLAEGSVAAQPRHIAALRQKK